LMSVIVVSAPILRPPSAVSVIPFRKMHLISFVLVVGLATTGFAADKSFRTVLSGSECVPAVETMAKGEATFTLSKMAKG